MISDLEMCAIHMSAKTTENPIANRTLFPFWFFPLVRLHVSVELSQFHKFLATSGAFHIVYRWFAMSAHHMSFDALFGFKYSRILA